MLAWRIALRYLFSKKTHGAVNIISIVSVAGVAVATAAIVIVLSVFNGFADLATSRLSILDPDLKVVPSAGKTIANADSLCLALSALPQVAAAQPVVEERGLAICDSKQKPVIFKGVAPAYDSVVGIDSIIVDGFFGLDAYGLDGAVLSPGVAIGIGARPGQACLVNLYVPRRIGRINPANPAAAFREHQLITTGVFQLDQPEYDADYMLVPLSAARDLLEYTTEATAIELAFAPGVKTKEAVAAIEAAVGPGCKLLTRQMQQEQSWRMIQIEKWVTFLMLAFILVIASFNIVSTLSLLVIEKRENIATLHALGANSRLQRGIFVNLSCIISIAGGIVGIILGTALALVQQWGGFIRLTGDPAHLTISVYPVSVAPLDLLYVFGIVVVVALAIAAIAGALARR